MSHTPSDADCKSLHCGQVVMVDPVIAADGHTYERVGIEQWLLHKSSSPVTGVPFSHTRLIPNVLIKQAIACQQQQPR